MLGQHLAEISTRILNILTAPIAFSRVSYLKIVFVSDKFSIFIPRFQEPP